jgi:iron complex transport system substrate-binding protein
VRHRTATARVVAAGVLAALLLGACGGDDAATRSGSSTPDAAVTRAVDTEFGEVEVPTEARRVVALDEYAALNAMALGVEPVLVFGAFQSEVGGEVLGHAGIDVQPASAEAGPDFEAIAAARPDLVLFTTEGAFASHHDRLSQIAPSVSLPYTTPWRDVIGATAEVFGREDEAERVVAAVEGRLDEVRADVATDRKSLSILGDTFGMVFAASMKSPLSMVVEEVGFTRPDAQENGTPEPTFDSAVVISTETLAEHDADLVALLSGAYYEADTFLDAPTFQALSAVEAGNAFVVDGDMWFGSYPFAIYWLLEDLAALHAGDGQDGIGTVDDTDARWGAFQRLVR